MPAKWDQYQAAGEEALKEGDYPAAEIMWRGAYELVKDLPKLDARVTSTLEGLSEALYQQGKFLEAEPLVRRALELFITTRGPEHPDVGVTASNLGMLYKLIGRLDESEHYYQLALTILTKALGEEHPDVTGLRARYAELLCLSGRTPEADKLKNNTDVANSAHLTRSGQYQVMEVSPAQVPADTIEQSVAQAVDLDFDECRNLAERAASINDYANCEKMWKTALKKGQAIFAPDDRRLCTALESLAEVLFKQARYSEAEPYCKQTLELYKGMLGKDHRDVGIVAGNLAMLYHAQDKYAQAEYYYQQALPIRHKALGPDHPSVVNLTLNYANLLLTQGRKSEADRVRAGFTASNCGRWSRSGSYKAVAVPNSEKLHA